MSVTERAWDYVIIGGGTAGCILANRLSADPKISVLVLEAGTPARTPWIRMPAGFVKLMNDPAYNWRFRTEPESALKDRRITIPRGRGLGGSSLINGMIYVRGQPEDYDSWSQSGALGWSFEDVLPYFRKLESFAGGDPAFRGQSGPVNVVRVTETSPISDSFIEAGAQAGFPVNADYNGADQTGFGYYQVLQKNGARWHMGDAYLDPARKRANLAIETGAQVTEISLDGRSVRAVCYRQNGQNLRVRVGGEVILAAGAVQSPQILELSGIGDPGHLSAIGLATRHALAGVGRNYQDHFATRMNWRVSRGITLNEKSRGWRLAVALAQYALARRGILTLGTGLAHGFVRSRAEVERPDVQYFFVHASYADAGDRKLDRFPGMTIGVTQMRPQSRGTIHARSADPFDPPEIRPNFLDAPIDQQTIVDGMKVARRIMAQQAMQRWIVSETAPGAEIDRDTEWLDFARSNGQSIYHPVGTCAMGAGPMAVVDCRLRVHGLQGLRVVDASVMPTLPSANTQAAVMMIAEKAADMILQDAFQKDRAA
tara:strand:- start:17997 stop:19622 length:1626 start_codon:yes stop_codon:yes gene_type:complete